MSPISLLIVDDHTLFRQGLVSLLLGEPGFRVVGEAADGEEALQLAAEVHPDVVLMDVKMPGMDGVETTRRLLETMPQVHVLMLTVSEEDESLLAAIQAGARGYILKNADADDLLKAIRNVHAGAAAISPAMAARLFQTLRAGALPSASLASPLTEREQAVARLLAQGASNRQIAEALVITENTVKTHVRNVLRKLELRSRGQVTGYARRL
jgi:DNA-binding NarL/FixJ family response regulator